MGSGVKYRRRNDNLYMKIGIVALISVPILYLIFNWTKGSNHSEMYAQRRPVNEPYIVEGIS